ncbi:MAG: hypothetical protein JOZ32_14660 [Bryobacterales bacterium]|nr:hypothetical protein [Bryobacterales bacterium]
MKIVRLVVLITATVFFGAAAAQTTALSAAALSVNDSRPVNVLAEKIEALSGIPVNYEDVQYAYAADTVDVTSSVVNPSYPAPVNFQVIIPRAAQLSALITVDAATQKLSGPSSALNALNEVLRAASANTAIAGKFTVENYENVFFIYPAQARSATGQFVPYTPVLSTPIDVPGLPQTAIETLEAILQQVSEKVGVKVGLGTMPFKAFRVSTVTISASQEPANYVLARLFAAVCASGVAAPQSSLGMSYHAFFDPRFKSYALNIHVVANPNVAVSSQNPFKAPIQSTPSRWRAK